MAGLDSKNALYRNRLRFLATFFLLGFLVLAARLADLQVASGAYWKRVADSQHGGEFTLLPKRGEIQAQDKKNGQVVTIATTAERPLVYAVPSLIDNVSDTAARLAPILELEQLELESRLGDKQRQYVVIKRSISDVEAGRIGALGLKSVRVEEDPQRFYPHGDLLGPVLGFVGFRDGNNRKQGLYGIERAFEAALKGDDGSLTQERASRTSVWIFGGKREFVPAADGETFLLSIDLPLQRKVEEIIKTTLEKHGAQRGCAIVMEPANGALLAMASLPGFDPNSYNQVSDPAVYNNVCLSGYEPGSVFKPITMAGALDEGKVTSDTVYTDEGRVKLDGFTIKNSDNKAHGEQTMTQVLEASLNTGAIFAKDRLGDQAFTKWVRKFGFGKETGIELPESLGNLKNLDAGGAAHFATASFGQGISATPMQVVNAFATIANAGKRPVPFIVQSRIKGDGTRTDTVGRSEVIMKPSTATTLTGMLVSVVENGHGKRARVKGYSVAGKTGTAQVVLPGGKGYDEHKTIGTFVGFAPAFNSKFVVLVRIDNPTTVQFAESTAAPAFAEIMRYTLDRFNISPDKLDNAVSK